ncbi:MAG: hypothetical protein WCJ64_18515 [Rhodospirillaceae bacterium]
MTIFAIISRVPNPTLSEVIRTTYPNDHQTLVEDSQWLVSAKDTAVNVAEKLGLGADGTNGPGMVLGVSSYFGRAPINIWEWMKVKWDG